MFMELKEKRRGRKETEVARSIKGGEERVRGRGKKGRREASRAAYTHTPFTRSPTTTLADSASPFTTH